MNFLDIILIIILGLSALRGFRKGLILELATFAALLLGVWAGFYFSGAVSGWLENAFDYQGEYINIISFLIIFICVIVLVQLLARVLERSAKALALGLLNKLMGAFFAVLKALLILSVLIYFMNRFDDQHRMISDESRNHSGLFRLTESIAPALMPKMKAYSGLLEQIPGSPASTEDQTEE